MTRRVCHACREPLGEAYLKVHDAQNPERSGSYHLAGCFTSVSIVLDRPSTAGRLSEVLPSGPPA